VYTLKLTAADRRAIDWIGNRYRHGDELFSLLWLDCKQGDANWYSDQPSRFDIPEHVAWHIVEIIYEGLECFSDDLRSRLWEFADSVSASTVAIRSIPFPLFSLKGYAMQTITTKYLPATNCRGSRIKVTASGGISRTYSYNMLQEQATEWGMSCVHSAGVAMLCHVLKWNGKLVKGDTKDGHCFVFVTTSNRLEV